MRGPAPVKSDWPLQGAWGQRAVPATGPNGSEDVIDYAEDDGDGQGNIENNSPPVDGEDEQVTAVLEYSPSFVCVSADFSGIGEIVLHRNIG